MTRLTDDALSELARLAEEATPGDWYSEGQGDMSIRAGEWDEARGEHKIAVLDSCGCCGSPFGDNDEADLAYLLAANPATVAALVAEVQRLRAAMMNGMHHVDNGLCADVTKPDARDPDCPACRLLDGVE